MTELAPLCEDFLAAIDLERNYSRHTLRCYRHNLTQFLNWLDDQGREGVLSDLTSLTVREFLGYLRDRCGNDPRTIAHKLGTLKSLLSHLRETLPLPQATALPKITWRYKYDKKLQKSLNQPQLHALLAAVRQRVAEVTSKLESTTGKTRRLHKQIACCHRDLLMLVLMAGVGLRVGELCGLNLKDIDLTDRSIRVLGKGRKERIVYFDLPQLVEAMGQYLQHRSLLGGQTEAVFLNARDGSRLTTRAVELLLKDYLQAAGLDQEATPHSLRHTFASLSIERGANVKAVSQILGHAWVSTTLAMYTHLSNEHVRKVLRLFNPLNPQRLSVEEVVASRRHALMFIGDRTNYHHRRAVRALGG